MFGKKETVVINVQGMMCNKCASHVEEALKAVSGVKKVEISLENKNAVVTVKAGTDRASLVEAVVKAGYQAEI